MKLTAPENLTINFDEEEFIPEVDEIIQEIEDDVNTLTWWD